LGPAWTGRGRPPADHFTKRTAEDWLRDTLDEARRGTLVGMVRTGATFEDAAAEFIRYCEHDRALKPSTLRGYRSVIDAYLVPEFGERRLEAITSAEVEAWRASLIEGRSGKPLTSTKRNRLLVLLHGVFRRAVKVWGLPVNPVSGIERQRVRSSGDIEVFSTEEVWALVRAAASEQDGAIYLTAAFTGLRRGELIAALARRRFRRPGSAGPRELRRRPADEPEVGQGPFGAARTTGRTGARATRRAPDRDRRRRPGLPRRRRQLPRRLGAATPLHRSARASGSAPASLS
jgi:hypothetical protein